MPAASPPSKYLGGLGKAYHFLGQNAGRKVFDQQPLAADPDYRLVLCSSLLMGAVVAVRLHRQAAGRRGRAAPVMIEDLGDHQES